MLGLFTNDPNINVTHIRRISLTDFTFVLEIILFLFENLNDLVLD